MSYLEVDPRGLRILPFKVRLVDAVRGRRHEVAAVGFAKYIEIVLGKLRVGLEERLCGCVF